MTLRVVEERGAPLDAYATIPIAFVVRAVLDVGSARAAAIPSAFVERPVSPPAVKDYDAMPGEGPRGWPALFAGGDWTTFSAFHDDRRVGGAVVVRSAPKVDLLKGQPDVAILWDIRVSPARRRHGTGGALLGAVERWAAERGAAWLMVETQDVNVPACRFYARHGFQLRHVHADAYPDLPHETQLLWYKQVPGDAPRTE